MQSEFQPSWQENISSQPIISEQPEHKLPERGGVRDYKLMDRFLVEDITPGFEIPSMQSTTIYSQSSRQSTASKAPQVLELLGEQRGVEEVSEVGEYSVTSRTTDWKEETTERKVGAYAGSGASGSYGFPESSLKTRRGICVGFLSLSF